MGAQSTQDRQWFLVLVALPVAIQLFLKRAVILNHLRLHWYIWAISMAVCLVAAVQLSNAQLHSSSSMADMLRTYFFSWVGGEPPSSRFAEYPRTFDGGNQVKLGTVTPLSPYGETKLNLIDPSTYFNQRVTWKAVPDSAYQMGNAINIVQGVLYHGLIESQ
ncbi:hypothetical protein [Pseudovibrio sp. Tun.PSC04-5.I4]|uniref:hypothetical protein n=1 Tax=Pseudovibrio sp. Tun.PSC04-5.I4 TaxID=1798213 RepID=UPI00117B82FF|nr:hypothetical protein [Pseudovibrio sp. Tun.PSC04-5.I4]